MEVNFGSRATDSERYNNKRTEMWDKLREWLEAGGAIPNNSDLKTELSSPTYSFDASGRQCLESKDKLKERGLRSPDMADALALTFAFPVQSNLIRAFREGRYNRQQREDDLERMRDF